MKVGTDGVLLGAWASVACLQQQNVLDIGTGTGLIALMIAQRNPHAMIEGIDIDNASIEQAQENVAASPFRAQIAIDKRDFRNMDGFSNNYHLIVSNPPFYQEDTLGGNTSRDAARHTVSLPFETLISNARKLLHEEGLFGVITPHQSAADFISICAQNQLYLQRRTDVQSTPRKPFNRTLLEFGTHLRPTATSTLTLYDTNNQRTAAYTQLTKDFYL